MPIKNLSRLSFAILPILLTQIATAATQNSTTIRSGTLTVTVSDAAEITAIRIAGKKMAKPIQGSTLLQDCRVEGPVTKKRLGGGGVEFHRKMIYTTGRTIELTERFTPTPTSVHWEIELASGSTEPWTTPVQTHLTYPASSETRFWTAWGDPELQDNGWRDPLAVMPVKDQILWYGALPFSYELSRLSYTPFHGNVFAIPLATFMEPKTDTGFSVVLSPRDLTLDLSLETTARGDLTFSRIWRRLGGDQPVHFSLDLVRHEADWRGGLRWITKEYADYFNPALPIADELAGTGAYSTRETDCDAEKMRHMAFRTNWKASYDFPYMGMFLPPVDDTREWNRFCDNPVAADPDGERAPNGRTSIRQLADYSHRMRKQGFFVLNYFNVTEFGALIQNPAPARHYQRDEDLWKDANDFLYARLKDAIMRVPLATNVGSRRNTKPGGFYYSWGDAIVLDCGDPAYANFLVDQARRHIEKLPDSAGICIDRMDWLRLYNEEKEDGISWFAGKPTRSLLISWNRLMDRIGPMMHNAEKVVFCNNHDKRLDALRYIDGIFDEHTYGGAPLNLTAFVTLRKPAMGWTRNEDNLKPDPDAFFQKYLYLGVYPMAPFPGNDHSLLPSEWVDKWYLDYGPLLDLMRGKKWVLAPHAVEVTKGHAKANIFERPGGYVIPVTFGGNNQEVTVAARGIKPAIVAAEVFYPGNTKGTPLRVAHTGNRISMAVPLQRGCAMVLLRTALQSRKPQ